MEFEGKFQSLFDLGQFRRRERGDATAEETFRDGENHIAVDDATLRHSVDGGERDFAGESSCRPCDLSHDELIACRDCRRASE